METRHFVTLLDWMRSLGLKGNELIAYAIIFGFSQDEDSDYHGSVAYIADWCGISRQQATAILQKLTDAGHITKTEDPGRPAHYRAAVTGQGVKFPDTSNYLTGGVKKLDKGCQETLHNNKEYNKEDNKDSCSLPRAREEMNSYGEYVRMTSANYARLVSRFGADDAARLCEILDSYLAKKPNVYRDHYRAALGWPVTRLQEEKLTQQRMANAKEQAQRQHGYQQGPPPGNYARLADANRRLKELEEKYK